MYRMNESIDDVSDAMSVSISATVVERASAAGGDGKDVSAPTTRYNLGGATRINSRSPGSF
jgi:hypothetical protein